MAGKVEKQARLIVGGNNVNCFMFHSKLNSQHFKEEEEKKKKKWKKNLSLKVFQNRHTSVVTIKLQNHNESSLDLSTCLSTLPLFT